MPPSTKRLQNEEAMNEISRETSNFFSTLAAMLVDFEAASAESIPTQLAIVQSLLSHSIFNSQPYAMKNNLGKRISSGRMVKSVESSEDNSNMSRRNERCSSNIFAKDNTYW